MNVSQKGSGATFLLWFFFGVAGIHRFYLGHYFYGFILLITLGGLGILWLIDFFLIWEAVDKVNHQALCAQQAFSTEKYLQNKQKAKNIRFIFLLACAAITVILVFLIPNAR